MGAGEAGGFCGHFEDGVGVELPAGAEPEEDCGVFLVVDVALAGQVPAVEHGDNLLLLEVAAHLGQHVPEGHQVDQLLVLHVVVLAVLLERDALVRAVGSLLPNLLVEQ